MSNRGLLVIFELEFDNVLIRPETETNLVITMAIRNIL